MRWKIEDNFIYLYEAFQERELIKTIPSREFVRSKKAWRISYIPMLTTMVNSTLNLDIPIPPSEAPKQVEHLRFVEDLYDHQKHSVQRGLQFNYYADFSQPGTGKTRVQIEMWHHRHDVFPALICCPKSIIEAVWLEQIRSSRLKQVGRVEGDHQIVLLNRGTADAVKKIKEYNQYKLIYITNYEMLPYIEKHLRSIPFNTMICDESTKIKNPQASRTKAALKIGASIKYKTIMSGTPAPNSMLDIFTQVKFLTNQIFGHSYYGFRSIYFQPGGFENHQWFLRPGAIADIKSKITPFSVQHYKRNCVDLPPLVHENRYVELSQKQLKHYNEVKDEMLTELDSGEIVRITFSTSKMIKLRQIASGFIYYNHDEERQSEILGSSKIKEVVNIIDELGDSQVIVFAHFHQSTSLLHSELSKRYQVGFLEQGVSSDQRSSILESFKNGQIQILIANPSSAGHGLNLQFCSEIIYYEHDFSLETYEQSVQRIERIGQQNKMTVYHVMSRNTLEDYVLRKLNSKIDMNKALDVETIKEMLS